MKRNLFEVTDADKKRILNLHQSRTKQQYLNNLISEQEDDEPLKMCNLNHKIKGYGEESNDYVFEHVEIIGVSDGVLSLIVSQGSQPLRYVVSSNGSEVFDTGYLGGRIKYSESDFYDIHPIYVATLTSLKDVGDTPKRTFKEINELYYSILSTKGKSEIKNTNDLNRLVFNENKNQPSGKNTKLQEAFDDLRELWKKGFRTFVFPQKDTQIKPFNYNKDMGVVDVKAISPFNTTGSIIARGGCANS